MIISALWWEFSYIFIMGTKHSKKTGVLGKLQSLQWMQIFFREMCFKIIVGACHYLILSKCTSLPALLIIIFHVFLWAFLLTCSHGLLTFALHSTIILTCEASYWKDEEELPINDICFGFNSVRLDSNLLLTKVHLSVSMGQCKL